MRIRVGKLRALIAEALSPAAARGRAIVLKSPLAASIKLKEPKQVMLDAHKLRSWVYSGVAPYPVVSGEQALRDLGLEGESDEPRLVKLMIPAGETVKVVNYQHKRGNDDALAHVEWKNHALSVDIDDLQALLEPKGSEASTMSKLERRLMRKPVTSHADKALYSAAKKTGQKLYGKSHTGLVWGSESVGEAQFKKVSSYQLIIDHVENFGEDALDPSEFRIGTYEFVFFPSRPGEGLDASDHLSLLTDSAQMADQDGNVYLCNNENETVITVVRPTVTSVELYKQIVEAELEKEEDA